MRFLNQLSGCGTNRWRLLVIRTSPKNSSRRFSEPTSHESPSLSALRILRWMESLCKPRKISSSAGVRLRVWKQYDRRDRKGQFESSPHDNGRSRSEEHTSELQSRQYLVCRLL